MSGMKKLKEMHEEFIKCGMVICILIVYLYAEQLHEGAFQMSVKSSPYNVHL